MLNGFISIVPLALGAGVYGFAFGVLAAQAGFSWLAVGAMGILVNAGSSQIVAVERLLSGGGLWIALLSGLALNLRYLGILASISPVLRQLPWPKRLVAVHLTSDENWALTLSRRQADQTIGGSFLIGAGLLLFITWAASTSLGAIIGGVIPDLERYGLGFAFTAAFIAMARGLWAPNSRLLPWICSFLITLVIVNLSAMPAVAILVGSVCGVGVASLQKINRVGGQQ